MGQYGVAPLAHRHAAEMAINQMQGYPIGNSHVVLGPLPEQLKFRRSGQETRSSMLFMA